MSAVAPTLRHDAKVIGWVSVAHAFSHFTQLVLPPLFPAMRDTFDVSYAALGLVLSAFYAVSGLMQTPAGFAVDRFGARAVLVYGLTAASIGLAVAATAQSYWMLFVGAVIAGSGNAVFHPADLALLNGKVGTQRLGYAFSVHNIGGNMGWVLAPLFVIAVSEMYGWRGAVLAAAGVQGLFTLAFAMQGVLASEPRAALPRTRADAAADAGLLLSRPVLMCFAFFFLQSIAIIGFMSFAPTAFASLYDVSVKTGASLLTAFLVGGIAGTLTGGFVATRTSRHEWVAAGGVIAGGLCAAAVASGTLAVVLLGAATAAIGFSIGIVNPSRDILVRGIAPARSRGKVYGFVYSGLDAGAGTAPFAFGWFIDHQMPGATFGSAAICLLMAIPAAFALKAGRAHESARRSGS